MITDNQRSEIRNYLLFRKLPIDVLMEVNDHFVSQITDMINGEDLGFDEAFAKTKNAWQKELKPYWNGSWDLLDRSKFQRDISRRNFISLSKKGLRVTVVAVLVLFLFSKILTFEYFKLAFVIVVGGVFFFPLINYYKNRKAFQLFKKYPDYVLISVQEYTLLSIGGLYFYFKFFTEGFLMAKYFSQFFIVPTTRNFVLGVSTTVILIFASFLTWFSQKIYLQKIEKVKPFLQYLKAVN